ncbi:MAG: DUF3990 domain-containing protein [Lachnospiraceae bacterium]|nr:DUF3990 domain-containing protein [Lachnospiraceae bacterium]
MILKNDTKLYHGSYIEVPNPDLDKCADGKDFGKGFYLTTDIKQAERFVKSSVGKAIKNGVQIEDANRGFVSEFVFSAGKDLKIHEFTDADVEWLHCVAAHRKKELFPKEIRKWEAYDVITGKIANDNTNQVITAYINGLYGQAGTERADSTAISLLMPEKLTDQICLRTKKALKAIGFVKADEYRIV